MSLLSGLLRAKGSVVSEELVGLSAEKPVAPLCGQILAGSILSQRSSVRKRACSKNEQIKLILTGIFGVAGWRYRVYKSDLELDGPPYGYSTVLYEYGGSQVNSNSLKKSYCTVRDSTVQLYPVQLYSYWVRPARRRGRPVICF